MVLFVVQVENDDGIWLKLSSDSVKKYCGAEVVESWTLAVAVSGRIYLAQEGDTTYQSQVIDTSSPPTPPQPAFPTAASVFGSPVTQKSIFGTPLVPTVPSFQFGSPKLQFGSSPSPPPKPPVFKFSSAEKSKKRKVVLSRLRRKLRPNVDDTNKDAPLKLEVGKEGEGDKTPPLKRIDDSDEASTQQQEHVAGDEVEESSALETEEAPLPTFSSSPTSLTINKKKALSPAVAECQRAVYAAFLWQEGLVHDAMYSAAYLKFNPELTKEMKRDQKTTLEKEDEKENAKGSGEIEKDGKKDGEVGKKEDGRQEKCVDAEESAEGKKEKGEEKQDVKAVENEGGEDKQEEAGPMSEKPPVTLDLSTKPQSLSSLSLLPPTLNHLVTFWDEISSKVLDNASAPFPAPKVPPLAQELLKRYEEEKKEVDKRKKEKDKKTTVQASGSGTTACELCEQSFPDPITYHMKDVHPGCGKHASGWGYNSRGTFCSGWAGNCGDGGRGGSTWYLMCKDCHAKYLQMKSEVKKKVVRAIPLLKMKTKKPGKPRTLPVLSAVQGMIQNSKFLLEISCQSDNKPATTPTSVHSPSLITFSKQSSFPNRSPPVEQDPKKTLLSQAQVTEDNDQRPMFLRSMSLAATSPLAVSSSCSSSELLRPMRTQSIGVKEEGMVVRQNTVDSPLSIIEQNSMGPLLFKPSINLARLMYNRSKHGSDSKEIGYGKVMAFVLQYLDLNGLRMAMKQSMRVAGVRAFAMEVDRDLLIVHQFSS